MCCPYSSSLRLSTFPYFGYNFKIQISKLFKQIFFSDPCGIAQILGRVLGSLNLFGGAWMFGNLDKWGMEVTLSTKWNSIETVHFKGHKLYPRKRRVQNMFSQQGCICISSHSSFHSAHQIVLLTLLSRMLWVNVWFITIHIRGTCVFNKLLTSTACMAHS